MIALMVPPLPAASRPSNTTITRAPEYTTHCWSLHSSVCSFRISFSYSLRFILESDSSSSCLDIAVLPDSDQSSLHRTRCCIPNLGGVLRDGSIAGELSGASHIDDGLARPGLRIGVQLAEALLGLRVRSQVRQVHE